ncbi:MAG: sigma-70 family RNA polymerase sigma factor [Planctomycetes bacterium]|nr:sigma-70 family RNA polymerase sigma factor [Planctomycetota bacterium]
MSESEQLNRDELINLVHTHQAQIYRYLRFLGAERDAAEDLAQETFVVAFEKSRRGQLGEIASQAAWLRGVARNLFLGHCRRAKSSPIQPDTDFVERAEALWSREAAGTPNGSAYIEALQKCLNVLPQREREIVDLQYARKRPRCEIAAAHGLTEDGVKTMMRRIRGMLAVCIQKRLGLEGQPC